MPVNAEELRLMGERYNELRDQKIYLESEVNDVENDMSQIEKELLVIDPDWTPPY